MRVGWVGDQDTVTLLLNSVDQPADDPLGLTREQFDADPYQTTPQAALFDTRKTSGQTQGGGAWRHRFVDAGALRESVLTAYAGRRDVTQWQAIPAATQASPRHPGGVIDFDRDYSGARRAPGVALGERLVDCRRRHRAAKRRPARLRELQRQR